MITPLGWGSLRPLPTFAFASISDPVITLQNTSRSRDHFQRTKPNTLLRNLYRLQALILPTNARPINRKFIFSCIGRQASHALRSIQNWYGPANGKSTRLRARPPYVAPERKRGSGPTVRGSQSHSPSAKYFLTSLTA